MVIASNFQTLDKLHHLLDLQEFYDVFLFDVWGVVYEGEGPYFKAAETITNLIKLNNKHIIFISNAPRPQQDAIRKISTECGIPIKDGHFFTSGQIALNMLEQPQQHFDIASPKIFNIGKDRNTTLLAQHNHLEVNDYKDANILLITAYRDDHENLNNFDEVLEYGAKNHLHAICANPDTIIVNGHNRRYCSGYFAEQYEKMGGTVTYTGKPKQLIYETMQQFLEEKKIHTPKSRILMIGDTLETDILGGNEFGIHTALVTTGNMRHITQNATNLEEQLALLRNHITKQQIIPNHIITLN